MTSQPEASQLTLAADLACALDAVSVRTARARSTARRQDALQRGLREGLREVPLVAACGLLFALCLRASGQPALSLWIYLSAAAAYPFARAGLTIAQALRARPSRRELLALTDDRLGLADRLVTADEFAQLRAAGPFHAAALRDGLRVARSALGRELRLREEREPVVLHASRALPIAALFLLATAFIGDGLRRTGDSPTLLVANTESGRSGIASKVEEERVEPLDSPPLERPDAPARSPRKPSASRESEARSDAAETDPDEKPSSGRASQGKGGEARGSSGASQARGAPSGQDPEAREPSKEDKKKESRRDEKEADEPEDVEKPAEEDSGSTAGKGSSRGSNKNPVTTSWKSRDQVSSDDDTEVEDDSDTEDDDEEQENRGGVQPSLRDRRPPVSRDLQIGFGNRPNPDANGRGGPSQPKKSRGVASLVLGVPIPDRVKGKPGPGRTKITQERVEPEAEDAPASPVEARAPRSAATGGPPPLDLDPRLRDVVRAYFLRQRTTAPADS